MCRRNLLVTNPAVGTWCGQPAFPRNSVPRPLLLSAISLPAMPGNTSVWNGCRRSAPVWMLMCVQACCRMES